MLELVLAIVCGLIMAVPTPAETNVVEEEFRNEVLIERTLPAVVAIRGESDSGIKAGSGFIVDHTGVVVTNLHVIENATRVAVKLASGETFDVSSILSYDDKRDLVLLKIAVYGVPVLTLGNSNDVRQGERVLAIGHPSGLENTVTDGIVSSVRVLKSGVKVIQISAAASPGNSGGPLLNAKGEAIGVVTFKYSGENLNFAIPINYVRGLLGEEKELSLDGLAAELSGKSDLFASDGGSVITGTWKSLETGSVKNLIERGDYLYGESPDPSGTQPVMYELKLQENGTYKGMVKGAWACEYIGFTPFIGPMRKSNSCLFEYEIVINSVQSGRIEGQIQAREMPNPNTSAFKRFCKRCGKGFDLKWQDFAWIKIN